MSKKKKINPTSLSDIESLLKQLLENQQATLETQKDIRALLLSARFYDDKGECDNQNIYSDTGDYLYMARLLDEASSGFAESKNADDTMQRRRKERELANDNLKLSKFWGDYLTSNGMKEGVLHLLLKQKISFKDWLTVLGERYGYSQNITRSSSELETKVRKYLKTSPDLREHFEGFLDEANKGRSNYANVPVNLISMNVILGLVG